MNNSVAKNRTSAMTNDQDELTRWATLLESKPPLDILKWAADRYTPRLTFATGFGPEGAVLIDIIGRHNLSIDIFTLDTGLLFSETYELWRHLENKYQIKIRSVKPTLSVEDQLKVHGDRLWERTPNQCCEIRKVIPLKDELKNVDAWITAIRREQTPQRANASVIEWDNKFGINKINPLVRWTKKDVWKHILKNKIPYNPLHDQGYPSIGCKPCTTRIQPGEDERAGRWRGIIKTECGIHGPIIPVASGSEKS